MNKGPVGAGLLSFWGGCRDWAVVGSTSREYQRRGSDVEQLARRADGEREQVEVGVVEQVDPRDDRPRVGGQRERDEDVAWIADDARRFAGSGSAAASGRV
jgi:hypothetical protein